jgi:hypothetical protein
MRLILILILSALLPLATADAQIWARQPGQPAPAPVRTNPPETEPDPTATPPGADQEPSPEPSAADQAYRSTATDAAMPRMAAPSGPAASLGGSGATGPDSVGILPARDTDFERTTWRYTQFGTVLGLMEQLPDRIDSAAEHELARNLLVAIADAPSGDDGGSRLLEVRVRKLLAMGNVADAAELARAAPDATNNPALAHIEVEAELLSGQIESACIDLRAFAGVLTDPASQTGLALCRQASGEAAPADQPPIDTASLGAMARIAGAPLAVDPATASPAQLVAMALDQRADPTQRLQAGFAAGRASALFGETLATLFSSAPSGQLSADGGAPTDGLAAATLYQAALQAGGVDQKVALVERGLLSPDGVSDKVGVAMTSTLRNFQPEAELGALAARIAILFFTVGDTEAAAPWVELAEGNGAAAQLWPYRVLLKQADPIGIGEWEQASGLDPAHTARVLTVLSAFGVTAPPQGASRVAGDERPEAPFGDLLAMDKSAHDLRLGETVLRALAVLGRDGPGRANPLNLRRALADLDQVSLHAEAHALAFEAITAALYAGRPPMAAPAIGPATSGTTTSGPSGTGP